MVFTSIRVTLTDPSGSRPAHRIISFMRALTRHLVEKFYTESIKLPTTGGLEKLNKYGEPCHPHIHFNFEYEPFDLIDPKRALREWCRKYAASHDFELKGNAVWSLQFFEDPEDCDSLERWWRYPLKERPIPALCYHPEEGFLEKLTLLARDERVRSVSANLLARQKTLDKNSLKDKLFKFLDDKNTESYHNDQPEFTHKTIWILILEYYTQEGKAISFQTINGYTILYQLYLKLITPEQAYEMRSNNH